MNADVADGTSSLSNEPVEPNLGHKAWLVLQRVAAQVLTTGAAVALAVFTVPHKPWNILLFIAGTASAAGAIFLESRKRSLLEQRDRELRTEREKVRAESNKVAQLRSEVEETAYELLVALSELCGGEANDLRTSIYIRQESSWVRLGRHSARTRYRESGRTVIPLEEGLLHRAYDRSVADAKGLPDRLKDPVRYEEEQCRLGLKSGMSPALVMAPRSYALFRIDSRPAATPGATFVLCFESDRPQGLDRAELEPRVQPWTFAVHLAYTRVANLSRLTQS